MTTQAAGAPVLVPVLANHRLDESKLVAWLSANLEGFAGPCTIRQFQGGQSNPTYHLQTPDAAYVLRKKPPGKLLPSAHAVDREFAVQRALAGSGVPVPKMHVLCTDDSIIGTMFYVMDAIPGRVFPDRLLPGCTAGERAAMYDDMNRVMAALHRVDYTEVGLDSFGRPQGYIARQIDRWSRQYIASNMGDAPEMEKLAAWLPAHLPDTEMSAIVHGDFRLGNLIFHPTEPRVVAVLDWELATLGHPLSDLAYNCIPWHTPPEESGIAGAETPGIPTEHDYAAAYYRRMGLTDPPDLDFYIVFSLFRWAAIAAGVYRRALDGNAADAEAVEVGSKYKTLARRAWELAQKGG
jgi:aminoglycoside phosphotransferase (APT) family kinase protein